MPRRDREHDYADCTDAECPRYPCRIYREGFIAGTAAGYGAGMAAGYAEGYSAGYQEGATEGAEGAEG